MHVSLVRLGQKINFTSKVYRPCYCCTQEYLHADEALRFSDCSSNTQHIDRWTYWKTFLLIIVHAPTWSLYDRIKMTRWDAWLVISSLQAETVGKRHKRWVTNVWCVFIIWTGGSPSLEHIGIFWASVIIRRLYICRKQECHSLIKAQQIQAIEP